MRLPCTPLISKGWTGLPSNLNDNDSDTSVLGCGATAIWNSNVVGAMISTSSSAPTSRFTAPMTDRRGAAHRATPWSARAPTRLLRVSRSRAEQSDSNRLTYSRWSLSFDDVDGHHAVALSRRCRPRRPPRAEPVSTRIYLVSRAGHEAVDS